MIQGNRIGTDTTGTSAIPNGTGVQMINAGLTRIGGELEGQGNVVSGNRLSGVRSFRMSGSLGVSGNRIGTDSSGVAPLGNGGDGVELLFGPVETTPSGLISGNTVAFNGSAGIAVGGDRGDGLSRQEIRANSIHDNGGLGIDLGSDGVTANDFPEGNAGPNKLRNYPILSKAISDGISTRIEGTLESDPRDPFLLEFFSSASCDASGFGEGSTFLGLATLFTDASGKASFQVSLPVASANSVVTATARDFFGNTSEFSPCLAVEFGTLPTSVPTLDARALAALALLLASGGTIVLARNRLP